MSVITFPPLDQSPPKSLIEARILHTRCLTRLQAFAEDRGIMLVHAEGYVESKRRGRLNRAVAGIDPIVTFTDAVHAAGGTHYSGVGRDHIVYTLGMVKPGESGLVPVTDGGAPVWKTLGEYWEKIHPACRWGGRFKTVDANHMSLEWQGRA